MKHAQEGQIELILFRCDGNAFVGSGHIMRCLAIADAARTMGLQSIFLTAGNEFEIIITAHGHKN